MSDAMDAISTKSEVFSPSQEVIENANVPDYLELRKRAIEDPVAFWDARAQELIDWYEPYEMAVDTEWCTLLQMVRWRQDKYCPQCTGSSREKLAQEQTSAVMGG